MKQKLAILLWATSPDRPDQCATPFFHAATAAAMDLQVEVYFSAASVKLLQTGVAANLYAGQQQDMSIQAHMQQALQHGARFFACADALDAHAIARDTLIPDLSGYAGAAAFMARALDPDWAILSY
jgi:hypothetical protein